MRKSRIVAPDVIPAVPLTGSVDDQVRAIDAALLQLERLRAVLTEESPPRAPRAEVQGPYINAPVWPWTVAGWSFAALFLVLFLVTWLRS